MTPSSESELNGICSSFIVFGLLMLSFTLRVHVMSG